MKESIKSLNDIFILDYPTIISLSDIQCKEKKEAMAKVYKEICKLGGGKMCFTLKP